MRELLVEICHGAGDLLVHCRRQDDGAAPRDKTNAGWVTQADLRSEALIISALRRADPEARIVAEESGVTEGCSGRSWFVDPLDGTTNFARGIPCFAVSVAGAVDDELRFAAIFQPIASELFYAERGGGSWLDHQRLRVGGEASLRRCVIGTGDLYERDRTFDEATRRQQQVYARTMVVRTLGSVALSLAYVAAGRLDGFFIDRYNTWDVAAGMLLVQEAGGQTLGYDGQPARLREGGSLVAGSAAVVAQLLEILGEQG